MLYSIPVSWAVAGYMRIEASDVEEAIAAADREELPLDHDYMDGSFEVDIDHARELAEEEEEEAERTVSRSPGDVQVQTGNPYHNLGG